MAPVQCEHIGMMHIFDTQSFNLNLPGTRELSRYLAAALCGATEPGHSRME